jgi:hypothetical protein
MEGILVVMKTIEVVAGIIIFQKEVSIGARSEATSAGTITLLAAKEKPK